MESRSAMPADPGGQARARVIRPHTCASRTASSGLRSERASAYLARLERARALAFSTRAATFGPCLRATFMICLRCFGGRRRQISHAVSARPTGPRRLLRRGGTGLSSHRHYLSCPLPWSPLSLSLSFWPSDFVVSPAGGGGVAGTGCDSDAAGLPRTLLLSRPLPFPLPWPLFAVLGVGCATGAAGLAPASVRVSVAGTGCGV